MDEEDNYWLEHIDEWYSEFSDEIYIPEDLLWNDDFIDSALQTENFEKVLDVLEAYDGLNGTTLYEDYLHPDLIPYYMTQANVRKWYSMLLDLSKYRSRFLTPIGDLYNDKNVILKALSLDPKYMTRYLIEYRLYSDSEFMKELQETLEDSDFQYIEKEIERQNKKDEEEARKKATRI